MTLLNSDVGPAGESKIVRRLLTERPVDCHGWRVGANWLPGAVRELGRAHRAATGFPEGMGQAGDLLFESGSLARLQRPVCSRIRRFLHLNRLLLLAPVANVSKPKGSRRPSLALSSASCRTAGAGPPSPTASAKPRRRTGPHGTPRTRRRASAARRDLPRLRPPSKAPHRRTVRKR
jgi:hypothetical protein